MLEMLLKSLGVNIDPVEIEVAWDRAKDVLPRINAAFQSILESNKRIEEKLDLLIGDKVSQFVKPNHPVEVSRDGKGLHLVTSEPENMVDTIDG